MGFLGPEGDPAWKRISTVSESQRKRSRLSSDFVVPGRILWLPDASCISPGVVKPLRDPRELADKQYGTPIVVCSRPAEKIVKVHFYTITSFDDKSLSESFPRSRSSLHERLSYLPILPSSSHPDHDKREYLPSLELVDEEDFPGNVFVNLRDVYAVDWRYLQRYHSDLQLEDHSLNELLHRSRQLSGYIQNPQIEVSRAQIPAIPKPVVSVAYRIPPVAVAEYPTLASETSGSSLAPRSNVVDPRARDYRSIGRHPSPEVGESKFEGQNVTRLGGCAETVGSRCMGMACRTLRAFSKITERRSACGIGSERVSMRHSKAQTWHEDPE